MRLQDNLTNKIFASLCFKNSQPQANQALPQNNMPKAQSGQFVYANYPPQYVYYPQYYNYGRPYYIQYPQYVIPAPVRPYYPQVQQPVAQKPQTENIQKTQPAVNAPQEASVSLSTSQTVQVENKIQNQVTTAKPAGVSETQKVPETVWKNDLRSMFQNNKAIIYALVMRSFNAKDTNGNSMIDPGEQIGTFLNAIDRLDELKGLGINTLHLLPVTPPSRKIAMGIAGSLYAPSDFLTFDPKLDDPNNPMTAKEEFRTFIKEAHKRGIRVMADLPSSASVEMYDNRPELMAKDERNIPKVPQGWYDIRMFNPWQDEEKGILNKPLMDLHKQLIDEYIGLGVDGLRVDVARAKPVKFWLELTKYAREKDPQFAFLAESYTYEDASPMANIPADRPEDLLKAGFDSYYGNYHIFYLWKTAKELKDYVTKNLEMSWRLPPNKSKIGSFTTHDDKSPMSHGGVPYCNMTTGLQMTLPMTNPYFVTGFESGDRYLYQYAYRKYDFGDTYTEKAEVHHQWLDIFNYSRKPGGENPEIGVYMSQMANIRAKYEDIITKGSFIPLKVQNNKEDLIIAYARHFNGRTLVIIANKDTNARQGGKVILPTFNSKQSLTDVAPAYGEPSGISAQDNALLVDLGPAKFHMFEVYTPEIEKYSKKEDVYRQNLS